MPPLIRNISDTARWVAVYRANETDRPDAVFRDPFARELAGDRGQEIFSGLKEARRNEWPFIARTYVIDAFITEQVREGVDMVINLAAGLDTRPYRMTLPASLQWIEIDLPGILDYKEQILSGASPVCKLERIRLDLSDEAARRPVFESLARRARRVLVVSEGLLIYLSADQVRNLARDLATEPSFQRWIAEIASPGLLRLMQRSLGKAVADAGAPFQFAPPEGTAFFAPLGWNVVSVKSMLRVAGEIKRLPLFLRLFSWLPDPKGPAGNRPWSGVCLLARS